MQRTHALDALRRREVFVSFPEAELDSRLVELFRGARNTLQEGGAIRIIWPWVFSPGRVMIVPGSDTEHR